MAVIAPTLSHVLENIERFKGELDGDADLQRRLAYARAWYAHQTEDGKWLFAPMKFCGYKNMTAKKYDDRRDGRRTEKQLKTWFTRVPEADQFFQELSDALTIFLAGYGKSPSTAFRISVTNDFHQSKNGLSPDDRALANLLIAVTSRLSPEERARLRAAL
ncbi:hypothetical protein [Rhizobium sp. ZPR3]|uniref:Uncharacterized protein n=2 Tax=unclassified Rhizobium TaxID=2613769 RepID=A0AAU7SJX8_9HYPH